jgi:hemolysin type calcium-binding protein
LIIHGERCQAAASRRCDLCSDKWRMGRRIAIALVAAAALTAPARADAAVVYVSASTGPAAETYIQYTAGGGERNRVQVHLQRSSVTIVDRGVAFLEFRHQQYFDDCTRTGLRRLVCPRAPIYLDLGDGDDTLTFAPGNPGSDHPHTNPLALQADYGDHEGAVVETTNVQGGSGNDVITGSRFDDVISPGPGRDRVEGRGGHDELYVAPDGRRDVLKGGGAIDALRFDGYLESRTRVPVTVDLAAGTAGPAGDKDRMRGIERVHGGPKADVLRGTDAGEAFYGVDGRDRIRGRGGNDLLVGNSPIGSKSYPDDIVAGEGDDVIDARGYTRGARTVVDCGAGADRELGEADDLLTSCESAVFRIPAPYRPDELPLYRVLMPVAPTARDPDGSPTFEVPCPARAQYRNRGCSGLVVVLRPDLPDPHGPPEELYGSGSFDLRPGERGSVHVPLNADGQAAVAIGAPVGIRVTADLAQPASAPKGAKPAQAEFGWQEVLEP